MFIILSLIGLAAAVWTWNHVHPVAGVVVGFLGIGGFGWKLLSAALGGINMLLRPGLRRHGPEFIAAWEALGGQMAFGNHRSYPPPGAFKAWLKEHKRTGISAAEWLHRQISDPG